MFSLGNVAIKEGMRGKKERPQKKAPIIQKEEASDLPSKASREKKPVRVSTVTGASRNMHKGEIGKFPEPSVPLHMKCGLERKGRKGDSDRCFKCQGDEPNVFIRRKGFRGGTRC